MRQSFSRLACLASVVVVLCSSLAFARDDASNEGGDTEPLTWPMASALVEQLAPLGSSANAVSRWANQTVALLQALTQVEVSPVFSQADRTAAARLLGQLQRQSQRVPRVAAEQQRSPQTSAAQRQSLVNQIYRVRYGLDRRLAIWQQLLQMPTRATEAGARPTMQLASRGRISFRPLDSQWGEYFLLGDVQKEFNSLSPSPKRQQRAARETLARMYSPVLKPDQVQFVGQAFDPELISLLKDAAASPVDIAELLTRIERHESNPTGATAYRLNDAYQSLIWSEKREQEAVGTAIHTHYRNANIRLEISGALLNRMVPEMPTMLEPVSERVMGASVSGRSQISNRLQVQLIPDPNQVQLRLQTAGTIHSSTVARRDGFAIQNQGLARFQVFKRLAIGRDGIDSSELPVAYSTAAQQVVGMRSKLDGVPVVGWLARRAASQKIQEQAPQTEQLVRNKVEREASERMQEQVEEQLLVLRQQTYDRVLQPLLALELEPEPVQMSTTDTDLVMRYRLAGRDQMAASTARPAEVTGSLCSCQIHESALNNAIARLGLSGNRFTGAELKAHMQRVLGLTGEGVDANDDEPAAEFEFAPFDPIRVSMSDQQLTIQLNLRSLKIGEGKGWQRLSVTTSYVPRVEGGRIVLEQSDAGLRLKGKRLRFRDQVAIRTVCEVLFQSQYEVNVLTPKFLQRIGGDVVMKQLVLTDGWLGLSIDDATQGASASASRIGQANRSTAARRSRR